MPSLFDARRYLTDFDSARVGHVLTDVLVVGSGVAGCRAAVEAAKHARVTLITKAGFDASCTFHAQGGIAAAIADDDSPQRHFDDTIRVGCGLCDPQAVRILVSEGPLRVRELAEWGMNFDRTDGSPALTREGGHSVGRVVHADGDRTGRELMRTLKSRVEAIENIRVFTGCFLIDLVTLQGRCHGAVTFHPHHGHQILWAAQTVLASGGCGQLWRETTNPPVATGDGLAAAFRAGATLRDLELMQFHPTTLYVAGAGRALISEAVRGEGGHLVDREGRRFMHDYHPDGELAPRDAVSRAIHLHLARTRSNCVYLDVRRLRGFHQRFPHIAALCADFQIDVTRDLIPVRPSAHYLIGGVAVTLDGKSDVEGLWCCGEAASAGVHGANRIASNSLLEGLVFGARVGEAAGRNAARHSHAVVVRRVSNTNPDSKRTALDLPDIRNSLRSLMWRNVGIVREGDRLAETCEILDFWAHYTLDKTLDDSCGWEVQNLLTVGRCVAASALARAESIGVHFRHDSRDDTAAPLHHILLRRDERRTQPRRVPHEPDAATAGR